MNKYVVVAFLSAVLLVSLNIKLTSDYVERKYTEGRTHGCQQGFTHLIQSKTGMTELPMQIQAEIISACIDSEKASK